MTVTWPQVAEPAAAAAREKMLWGLRPAEVHDAYWAAMGVSVARPGGLIKLQRDAGLFLLLGPGEMALLDFRAILDAMGWIRPALCLVRPRMASDAGAAVASTARLLRCALTPLADHAEAWCADDGSIRSWRRLNERVGEARRCLTRPLGRIYWDTSASDLLQRLARIWPDPNSTVPGLKKLGPGIFGMDEHTNHGSLKGGRKRHVWLGRGRSLAEVEAGNTACVLSDAE